MSKAYAPRVAPWPYGNGELSAREVLGPPAREKHAGERRRQGPGAAGGARRLNRGCDEVGAHGRLATSLAPDVQGPPPAEGHDEVPSLLPGAYHPGGGKRPDVHETWKALSGRAGRVGPDDLTSPHHLLNILKSSS